MANPKITADVTANTTDAVKDFDKVADSAEDMSKRVRRSSDELGESTDRLDGKASAAERGFRGFSDSLNGTSDVMGGLKDGNLVQLGMGMADLFGSVQDLFLPLMQQMAVKLGLVTVATEGQTAAQEASNVAMAANPIGLIVLALVALAAAFYVAWTKSETFRDIVLGALDAVKVAFDATVKFFAEHWEQMLAILTGGLSEAVILIVRHWSDIQGAVSRVFGIIKDVATTTWGFVHSIIDGVSGAVDWLISRLNEVIRLFQRVSQFVSTVGGFVSSVGGAIGGWFAEGGVVPGPTGQPVGIIAHAGEVVLNQRQQAALLAGGLGGGNVTTYYPAGYNRRELNDAQRRWQRINAGAGAPR